MNTNFRATALLVLAAALCGGQSTFVTVAGGAGSGFSGDGGPATSAKLGSPLGLAVNTSGELYITDLTNYRIRKVNAAGIISTYAGNGKPGFAGDGGPATSAQLFTILGSANIQGIATDTIGNLYITDYFNHRVRKVDPSGIITTFAGNGTAVPETDNVLATATAVGYPTSVAVDAAGNVYIADSLPGKIRKVDKAGMITTVAGTGVGGINSFSGDGGPATKAQLSNPLAIALDHSGNLFINDFSNGRIRKVDIAGIITTYAGNGTTDATPPSGDGGPATSAVLFSPRGISVDFAGNLFIVDTVPIAGGGTGPGLRKVSMSGIISSVPTTDQQHGADVAVDQVGNIFIIDGFHVSELAAPPPPTPVITSVTNGASFRPGVVANSWVTIQGTGLASKTDDWTNSIVNGVLPTSVDGVSVTMGGKPAYVYFISPGQLNVLAPDVPAGPISVTVTTPGGTSANFATTASVYDPAFFLWPSNQAVATRTDYSFAVKPGTFAGATTVAAKPGEVIILWATGFGPTTPAAPGGVGVPSDKTYATATLPSISIGNIPAAVAGAALAPGSAGLYQIAITVPGSLTNGDWPVQASIGGVSSPAGTILSVHQ